jgi:hypothetical protein
MPLIRLVVPLAEALAFSRIDYNSQTNIKPTPPQPIKRQQRMDGAHSAHGS